MLARFGEGDAVMFGSIWKYCGGANAAQCNNRSKNGPEQANQSKKRMMAEAQRSASSVLL
jgi:hypothetical protein